MRVGNLAGRLTIFTDGGAVDVAQASDARFGPDPQAIYEEWTEFVRWTAQLPTDAGSEFSMADLRPPAPFPRQVLAIGLNYVAHAVEAGLAVPTSPAVFTKFVTSFTGPEGDIVLSSESVDWEVELVAVIGRTARSVPAAQAWDYIAGVTVGQDLSDRVVQALGPAPQFSLGKSFPGYAPMGPWLVTPDELPDRDDLCLTASLNGEVVQDGRTSDMVFSVPALIERLSSVLDLLPGDVIFTGTPAGVGASRKPQRFLEPGDELVTGIDGVGTMRHTFVAA